MDWVWLFVCKPWRECDITATHEPNDPCCGCFERRSDLFAMRVLRRGSADEALPECGEEIEIGLCNSCAGCGRVPLHYGWVVAGGFLLLLLGLPLGGKAVRGIAAGFTGPAFLTSVILAVSIVTAAGVIYAISRRTGTCRDCSGSGKRQALPPLPVAPINPAKPD